MKFLSELKNKDLLNKTCLLRVDFNLMDEELSGKNLRVQAILPTIKFLIENGARVVILSHRGRPALQGNSKSQITNYKQFSLKPFTTILSELLKTPVKFVDFENTFLMLRGRTSDANKNKYLGSPTSRTSDVLLLENLRFFPEEEKNDEKFAKKLASLGDFYVNDAFSVSHRKNASVVAITKFLASYAGFCLENEIKNLSKAMNPPHKFMWGVKNPKKPLIVILGGAKISDKIGTLKNFMKKASKFLIGGDYEKEIPFLKKFKKVVLPVDYIREKDKILDIGPKTSHLYSEIIKSAKTIIWNGPMGYIENSKFRSGNDEIIKAILSSHAFAIIGGGETVAAASKVKSQKSKVFLSTGGGAMLEFLSGKKLPGIQALK